jgi:hypothetical protein
MSPRRTVRRPPPPELRSARSERVEDFRGSRYVVRRLTGSAPADPGKAYRCPGCSQPVAAGVPHVVAWPLSDEVLVGGGPDDRRHWHTACWHARDRRGAR